MEEEREEEESCQIKKVPSFCQAPAAKGSFPTANEEEEED